MQPLGLSSEFNFQLERSLKHNLLSGAAPGGPGAGGCGASRGILIHPGSPALDEARVEHRLSSGEDSLFWSFLLIGRRIRKYG